MDALDTLPKTRHLEKVPEMLERLTSPYERIILDHKGKITTERVIKVDRFIMGVSDLGWQGGSTFLSIYDIHSQKYSYSFNSIGKYKPYEKAMEMVRRFNHFLSRDGGNVNYWANISYEQAYNEGRLVAPIIGYMVQGILHGVDSFDRVGRELLSAYTTTTTYQIPDYELVQSANIYQKYELVTRQLSNSSAQRYNSICVEVPPRELTLQIFKSFPEITRKNALFSVKIGVLEQFLIMFEINQNVPNIDKSQCSWTKANELLSDTCLLLPFQMNLDEVDEKTKWVIYRMYQLGLGDRIRGSLWLLDKLYKAHLLMQQNPVQ